MKRAFSGTVQPSWIIAAGLVVGLLYGLFGVGSAFATPMLAVLGVPGIAAVVGPLPGLLPGAAAGAWSYTRGGKVDWDLARRTSVGAFPSAILGALASRWVGGTVLLLLSGLVLLAVGVRVLRPESQTMIDRAHGRRASLGFVTVAAALVGFASGLLANGGGFLLVPLFLLVLGLDINKAAGTSMVVTVVLTVPTLVTHAFIGDIDWLVAGLFALGLVPGSLAGGHLAQRAPTSGLRRGFGVLLVGFAVWFLLRQAVNLT
jgi:uncharacterized membrane protein YfcA